MMYQGLKKDLYRRMGATLDVLKKDFSSLRTGRASPSLLDSITAEAYNTTIPLAQLATISVLEPRLLYIQVWDKSIVKAVEKAIRDAGLGLNPVIEGQQYLRVPVPSLSEERRLELVKVAHRFAEQARVSVRNVRRDGMDSLKKMERDGNISQDQCRQYSQEIQSVTDEYVQQIDGLLSTKEKEILQV